MVSKRPYDPRQDISSGTAASDSWFPDKSILRMLQELWSRTDFKLPINESLKEFLASRRDLHVAIIVLHESITSEILSSPSFAPANV